MDLNYLKDLYDSKGGETVFGKFNDFIDLMDKDDTYSKEVFNSFGGTNTFGEFKDFESLVKKKDGGASENQNGGSTMATNLEATSTSAFGGFGDSWLNNYLDNPENRFNRRQQREFSSQINFMTPADERKKLAQSILDRPKTDRDMLVDNIYELYNSYYGLFQNENAVKPHRYSYAANEQLSAERETNPDAQAYYASEKESEIREISNKYSKQIMDKELDEKGIEQFVDAQIANKNPIAIMEYIDDVTKKILERNENLRFGSGEENPDGTSMKTLEYRLDQFNKESLPAKMLFNGAGIIDRMEQSNIRPIYEQAKNLAKTSVGVTFSPLYSYSSQEGVENLKGSLMTYVDGKGESKNLFDNIGEKRSSAMRFYADSDPEKFIRYKNIFGKIGTNESDAVLSDDDKEVLHEIYFDLDTKGAAINTAYINQRVSQIMLEKESFSQNVKASDPDYLDKVSKLNTYDAALNQLGNDMKKAQVDWSNYKDKIDIQNEMMFRDLTGDDNKIIGQRLLQSSLYTLKDMWNGVEDFFTGVSDEEVILKNKSAIERNLDMYAGQGNQLFQSKYITKIADGDKEGLKKILDSGKSYEDRLKMFGEYLDKNPAAVYAEYNESSGGFNPSFTAALNTMSETTGQIVAQMLPNLLTDGIASRIFPTTAATTTAAATSAGARGLDAAADVIGSNVVAGISNSINAIPRFAIKYSTIVGAGFAQSYESAYLEAINSGKTKDEAEDYATKIGLVNGLSEVISPDVDIVKNIAKGGKGIVRNIADGIDDNIVTAAKNIKTTLTKAAVNYGRGYINTAPKEVFEEVVAAVGEHSVDKEYGINQDDINYSLMNRVRNAAVQTAIGMLGMPVGGMLKNIQSPSNLQKESLYYAAMRPNQVNAQIDSDVTNGSINADEAANRKRIVATAAKIGNNLPLRMNGTSMSTAEQAEYITKRVQLARVENTMSDAEMVQSQGLDVNELQQSASKLKEDIYDIRNGKYFGKINAAKRMAQRAIRYTENEVKANEFDKIVEPARQNEPRPRVLNLKAGDELVLPSNEKVSVESIDDKGISVRFNGAPESVVYKDFDEFENDFVGELFTDKKQFANLNPTVHADPTQFSRKLLNQYNNEVADVARSFIKSKNPDAKIDDKAVVALRDERSKKIAAAYEAMKNEPNNPEVKASYEALKKETKEQWDAIKSAGYTVEMWTKQGEPYQSSKAMADDVMNNKHLWVLPTVNEFGSNEDFDVSQNPLLEKTGDVSNNIELTYNDLFRAVHDFFGHAHIGNQFGAIGEENAWRLHSQMYSPLARKAMTTETRGQNSWVNFSGVNDEAKRMIAEAARLEKESKDKDGKIIDRKKFDKAIKLRKDGQLRFKFADQKIGLLPDEFSELTDAYDEVQEGLGNLSGLTRYSKGDKVLLSDLQNEFPVTNEGLMPMFEWGKSLNTQIGFRGLRPQEGLAFYNYVTDEIYFNVNHPAFASLTVQDAQESIAHELIHKAAHYSFNNNEQLRNGFEKDAQKVIQFLREQDLSKLSKETQYYAKFILGENASSQELITYAMTNPVIANWFASLQYDFGKDDGGVKSIWQWMKDSILRFVSNVIKGKSVLDEAQRLMDKYVKLEYNVVDSIELDNVHSELMAAVNNSNLSDVLKSGLAASSKQDAINFIYEQATGVTNVDGNEISARALTEKTFGKDLVDKIVSFKENQDRAVPAQMFTGQEGANDKPQREENESAFDYAKRVKAWYDNIRKDEESTAKEKRQALLNSKEERTYIKDLKAGVKLLRKNIALTPEEFNKEIEISDDNYETYIASLQMLIEDKENRSKNKTAKQALNALRKKYPKKVYITELSLMRKQWNAYKYGYQNGYATATEKAKTAYAEYKQAQQDKNKEKMDAAKARWQKAVNEQKAAKELIHQRQKYFKDKIDELLSDLAESGAINAGNFDAKDILKIAKSVSSVVSDKSFVRLQNVVNGLIDKSQYTEKVSAINTWRKQIQKLIKSGTLTGNDLNVLRDLNKLNPSQVSDIDTMYNIYKEIIANRKEFNPAARQSSYTNEGIQNYIEQEQNYDLAQRVDYVSQRYEELTESAAFKNLKALGLVENFDDDTISDLAKGVKSAPDKVVNYREKVSQLNKIEDAVRAAEADVDAAIQNERLDSDNAEDVINMDDIIAGAMQDDIKESDRTSNRLVLEEQAVANQQVINLADPSLSNEQISMLSVMKEIDVSNWDAQTLRLFMNTLQNIYDNSDNIGFGIFKAKHEAQLGDEMKKWVELIEGEGYKVRNAEFGHKWVKINASVDNFISRLANNSKTLRSRFIGVTKFGKIRDQATIAINELHNRIDKPLADILKSEKISVDDIDVQAKLSLYSWLLQNKDGSLQENNAELKRRLGEIVNDIQVKEKAGKNEIKESEIERKIFYEFVEKINQQNNIELIIKNDKGVEIVNPAAADQINIDNIKNAGLLTDGELKVYNLYRSVYDQLQPDFVNAIRMYENKELVLWNNYMKDTFRELNGDYITGNFANPSDGTYFAAANTLNMTSDSAIDRVTGNRITALDEQLEKLTGEKKSRGINLNFFKNQTDNVGSMLMDIHTLADRAVANEVFNNNDFIATAGGIDNVNLAKEFMLRELRNMMGVKTERTSDAVLFWNKLIKPFSQVAVKMQLADAGQYIKQASSQLFGNATVDLLMKGAGSYPMLAANERKSNQDVRTLIAKSLISQRSETRGGTNIYGDKNLGELNDKLKDKSVFSKTRDKLLESIGKKDKYTKEEKQWATWFLQAGDTLGAEVSWVAYYAHNLVSNGIYPSFNDIDWSKESQTPNADASAYAQDAVANLQNVTSSASASSFVSDKNATMARALFGAFGSFAMNKFEIYNQSLRVFFNKGGAIENEEQRKEELTEAKQRFAAAVAEDLFYGFAVKMAFFLGKSALADALIGLIGADDEEEKKKKKSNKKSKDFRDKAKQLAWSWFANTAFSWTTSTGQDIIQSSINDIIKTRGGEPVFYEGDGRNMGTITAATQNFWKDIKRVYQTTIAHGGETSGKDKMIAFVALLSNAAQASDMNFADINRVIHSVAERYDRAVLQDEIGADKDLNDKRNDVDKITVGSGIKVEFTDVEKELYDKSREEYLDKLPKEYRDNETMKRNASEYAKGMVFGKYGKEISERLQKDNK